MNILYIHGFASTFSKNDKVLALEEKNNVYGVCLDYTKGYDECVSLVFRSIIEHEIDVLVGTSMGGYMAATIGEYYNIPFVSLNPTTDPSNSLKKYLGEGVTYFGESYYLGTETVETYNVPFPKTGDGVVVVETDDEVIPFQETFNYMIGGNVRTIVVNGGSHRFDNVAILNDIVREVYLNSTAIGGNDI